MKEAKNEKNGENRKKRGLSETKMVSQVYFKVY